MTTSARLQDLLGTGLSDEAFYRALPGGRLAAVVRANRERKAYHRARLA